jgi:hypothetical protein
MRPQSGPTWSTQHAGSPPASSSAIAASLGTTPLAPAYFQALTQSTEVVAGSGV